MELEDYLETKNLRQEVFKYYDENPQELVLPDNDNLYEHFYYIDKEQRPTLRNYKKEYKQEHAKLKLSNFYRKKQMVRYIERNMKRTELEVENDLEYIEDIEDIEEVKFDYNKDFSKEIKEYRDKELKSDREGEKQLREKYPNLPNQEYHYVLDKLVKEIMGEILECPPETLKEWLLDWKAENPKEPYYFT